MTNLEAIKAKVNFPLPENAFKVALLDRGASDSATYSVGDQSFELAYADCLCIVINSSNMQEGGFSVSVGDRKYLVKQVSAIYEKYKKSNPLKDKVKFVQPW